MLAVWANLNGLDCRACPEPIQAVRGCKKEVPQQNIAGFQLTRCPLTEIDGITLEYLTAYFEYNRGFLPNAGGWLDQPMKVMQAIRLIEEKYSEHEKSQAAEKKEAAWQRQNLI